MLSWLLLASQLITGSGRDVTPPDDCVSYGKAWKRISGWHDERAARDLLVAVPGACDVVRAQIAATLQRQRSLEAQSQHHPSSKTFTMANPLKPFSANQNTETTAWNVAAGLDNDNAYMDYLRHFPRGPHATDAKVAISRPFTLTICNKTRNEIAYARMWTPIGNLNPVVTGWSVIDTQACDEIRTGTPSIAIYARDEVGDVWEGNVSDQKVELCITDGSFSYDELSYCPTSYNKVMFWRYEWTQKSGIVELD